MVEKDIQQERTAKNFIQLYARSCSILVIPICLVGISSVALWWLGYGDAAYFVSRIGTIVTVLCVFLYIVSLDSKKRWPNDNWLVRLTKLLTFSRN